MRPTVFLWAFLVLAVGGAQAQVLKTEPLPATPPPDQVMAIYYLEDLFRDLRYLPGPGLQLGASHMKARLARQKVQLDLLKNHLRGLKKDEELLAICKSCERLAALSEDLKTALDKISDDALEPIYRLTERRRAEQSASALSAVGFLFMGVLGGEESTGDAIRGLIGLSAQQYERDIRDKARFDRLSTAAAKAFAEGAQARVKEYHEKFEKAYKEEEPEIKKAIDALAKRYEWKSVPEFDIAPISTKTAPRADDPFRVLRYARRVVNDPSFKKDAKDPVQERLKLAQLLIDMEKTLPKADPYGFPRLLLIGFAGEQANRAAAEEIGAAGFSAALKNPATAGKTAVAAWTQYAKYDKLDNDASGYLMHQWLLAKAYSGAIRDAYQYAASRPQSQVASITNAQFFYDAARIFAVMNDQARAQTSFQLAMKKGFRNLEEARISPDLGRLKGWLDKTYPAK